ncbi:Stf0 family sulfotransferase [Paracoccus aminophilus]|uniref:Sulphotransferase Stf0 domain-containing protein n=1 Tax=Paracoccus aminophilus JCM 7686 TaxID=1367847 RepID=S5YBE7_PARAH|nr:Stf0 family sulfotransferase [Paracoccus aminophilus]AGT08773.1 hypothetical protein JCM7686_1672 [Paracoccus aminophilus JCM 7686]
MFAFSTNRTPAMRLETVEIMSDNIFDPNADQGKYNYWTKVAAPSKTYAILFTPRSGSSWLTSILSKTQVLGTPEEWFNPSLMPRSSRDKGARNLDQFVEAISRHQCHGDIFGFEITYHQLMAVFKSTQDFIARFQDATFFWLTRDDIVAQGISLDKMVQTNVHHAAQSDARQIENSDTIYNYDAERIKGWICHIHAAETGTEKMIHDFGLSVMRLSYEEMTATGARGTASLIAETLGLENFILKDTLSDHRKIATRKNNEFAERFYAENAAFVDEINAARGEWRLRQS